VATITLPYQPPCFDSLFEARSWGGKADLHVGGALQQRWATASGRDEPHRPVLQLVLARVSDLTENMAMSFNSKINLKLSNTKTVGGDRINRALKNGEDVAILYDVLQPSSGGKNFHCALDQYCLHGNADFIQPGRKFVRPFGFMIITKTEDAIVKNAIFCTKNCHLLNFNPRAKCRKTITTH